MKKSPIVFLLVILAGCAATRAKVTNPMTVRGIDYDKLWQAGIDVISEDFDIPYMNKEEGAVRTTFREGGSLINFWESDASSFKGLIRETFHKTRRMVALNLGEAEGGARIEVQVFKHINVSMNYPTEHATEPYLFDPRQADYYPRDSNLFPLTEDAYVLQSAVWIPDGRDADYERQLVDNIIKRARK